MESIVLDSFAGKVLSDEQQKRQHAKSRENGLRMKCLLLFVKIWLIVSVLLCSSELRAVRATHGTGLTSNPVVIGAWWDTTDGSYWTDQQLADDVHNLKWMNFTAIYCVEKTIMDGSKDDELNDTWTARMVKLAENEGLKIVWAVWETDNPAEWSNRDLNNQTFRIWFAEHLVKWQGFIVQHPCIIELVFDDFGVESQYLNMTEFTQFVRQYVPLPTMIEYDDKYDSLNPQFGVATVTEGYVYYYQDSRSWDGFWIDYICQHYNGYYPFHTLGISLEAFDGGMGDWTPTKHLPLIEKALDYGFTHYEYWAWRWGTPELPAIAVHSEYWQEIRNNNEHILTHLTVQELTPTTIMQLLICTTLLVIATSRMKHRKAKHELDSPERRNNGQVWDKFHHDNPICFLSMSQFYA